jgi:hypothetical protein
MKQWKFRDTDKCPRCGLLKDRGHVRRYQHVKAVLMWTEAVTKLTEWMDMNETHPEIAKAISSRLLH